MIAQRKLPLWMILSTELPAVEDGKIKEVGEDLGITSF